MGNTHNDGWLVVRSQRNTDSQTLLLSQTQPLNSLEAIVKLLATGATLQEIGKLIAEAS